MVKLPEALTVYDLALALDGGTICLRASDAAGHHHTVMLVQHAFPHKSDLQAMPGRLYFDGEIIDLRSNEESKLLALLRAARVQFKWLPRDGRSIEVSANALMLGADIQELLNCSSDEDVQPFIASIICFVESDKYLRFADRVEQAADTTRYTVWVAHDPATYNRVLVRLGQFLGVGIQRVKEMLENDAPLAERVTAVEISDLAWRCRCKGLPIRVEPAFRWRLDWSDSDG